MKPRVAFKTIGCRLNQAETARITAQFRAAGYQIVPFGESCDVAVIHGCTVTRNAERDSRRAARAAKRAAPGAFVVLAGCPAEIIARGEPARRTGAEKEGVDLLAGQADKFRLPELIHQASPGLFPLPPAAPGPLVPEFDATRALIKVQDGCDFRCAYCIVPDARGAPASRPIAAVIEEIRSVAESGFKEVVLTGANLGCYADGDSRLVDLIRRVEEIPGVERIRLSSIEMTTAERPIIDHMARSPKLCHFLHIPMQSGDDRMLRAMGRRYTSAEFRAVAEYAASRVPMIGLGTDVIVGFPGEDDAAFENTVRVIEDLPLSNLHVFPYSPRPNTRAADMKHQIPHEIAKSRVQRLLEIEDRKRRAFAQGFIGHPVAVLIEEVRTGLGRGWTGEYLEAEVRGPDLAPNRILRVTPSRAHGATLLFHPPVSSPA